jgi:hypothetical protein
VTRLMRRNPVVAGTTHRQAKSDRRALFGKLPYLAEFRLACGHDCALWGKSARKRLSVLGLRNT